MADNQRKWNHQYQQVNGISLHFVREGQGFPVVLLHGWPGFWWEWHLNIPVLAAHFDVIAPDLRGFAYSEKPDLPPEIGYTPAALASDIAALVLILGFSQVAVAALDVGAVVAQELARTHPELVKKLVLLNPPYPGIGVRWFEPGHFKETWYQYFHQLDLAEKLVGLSREGMALYLRHFLSHWSFRNDLFSDEEIEEYVEAYSQPGALRGAFNWYRGRQRHRETEGKRRPEEFAIHVPTLVLWGDGDAILPLSLADRLPEYFTRLTFKVVPRCGHFVQRECPEVANAEILSYFSDLR
jgi:pimeloyl-ACP methyl ester carboxylesterase